RFVAPQARRQVAVRKPDGSARTMRIASRVFSKPAVDVDELVAELEDVLERARDRIATIDDSGIVVWKMPVFGNAQAVDDAIVRARAHRALVLDLRGNGGGAADTLKALVAHCFDRDVVIGSERRRD